MNKLLKPVSFLLVLLILFSSLSSILSFTSFASSTGPDGTVVFNEELNQALWPAFVSTEQVKFGTKALKSTTGGGADYWMLRDNLPVPLDIYAILNGPTKDSAVLSFWIYISDKNTVSNWNGSQAQLGNGWDNNSYVWGDWDRQITQNGWNEIILPFSGSGIVGNPTPSNITYINIRTSNPAYSTTVYIDNITVSSDKVTLPPSTLFILNDENNETGQTAYSNLSITTEKSIVGNKSYKATTGTNNPKEMWFIRQGSLPRALNISAITRDGLAGSVKFYVYIEDKNDIANWKTANDSRSTEFQIGVNWDSNVYSWANWDSQIKGNGWNEIVLPFEYASILGTPNPKSMSYLGIRIFNANHSATVYIDAIHICDEYTLPPEPENIWKYDVSGTAAAITGYEGTMGKLIIPSVLGGYPVTSISSNAFRDMTSITSVVIPESVTVLNSSAFRNCTGLSSVTIPEGVTTLSSNTFYNCSNLTNVFLPQGLTTISGNPFANCSSKLVIHAYKGSYAYQWATSGGRVLSAIIKKGDVNNNGITDQNDLSSIREHIFNRTSLENGQLAAADTDKNTKADFYDIMTVRSGIYGSSSAFNKTFTAYPQIISTSYESSNGAVIAANIKDFGAIGDGTNDDTEALENAINSLCETGGTLYLPFGTYKLTKEVIIPTGIMLLGDFNAPTLQNPSVTGTVLALYPKTVAQGNSTPFFRISYGSSMKGFSFWYPSQTLIGGTAVPYPYTISVLNMNGTTVEDLNLVNVYNGIDHASTLNNQQIARNIYGTPLYTGVCVNQVNDSNRYEFLNFSPDWWLLSGLPGVPDQTLLKNWLISNATGFDMRQIDWHFLSDLTVTGYKIGLKLSEGFGRAYNLNITNCNTCVYAESIGIYGSTITNGTLKANGGTNPVALKLGANFIESQSLTCYGVAFESTGSHTVELLGQGRLVIQNSSVKAGAGSTAGLYSSNGRFSAVNTSFDGGLRHVLMENTSAQSTLVNCTAVSGGLNHYSPVPTNLTVKSNVANVSPALDIAQQDASRAHKNKKPLAAQLFFAPDYGVTQSSDDIAPYLQAAIDAAYVAGGGTVYVPRGAYRLESPITVKSGVEILGTNDYFHYINTNATFFLTDYGKKSANGAALITLLENSGARGFNVSYDKVRQQSILYAATLRGQGSNIYVKNIAIAAATVAVDFETNRCDNHYIEGVNFCAFKTGIAVGGGSKNGLVIDCHSNTAEIWDNPFTNRSNWSFDWNGNLQSYQQRSFTAFKVGSTENQIMFFNIIFGSLNGIWADSGANVKIIGHGTDYSRRGIYLTGSANVTMVDGQLSGSNNSNAILAESGYTGTSSFYNLCTWAIRETAVRVNGGTVNIVGGTFLECGNSAVYAKGGNALISGVIIVNRSSYDIIAERTSSKTITITAFGNLYQNTPSFNIQSSLLTAIITKKGSDLT